MDKPQISSTPEIQSTQPKPKKKGSSKKPLSPFASLIEDALKQYHNPTWLGENSPLASPYLLEPESEAVESITRGQMLQNRLQQATDAIGGEEKTLYRQLITRRFFKRHKVKDICADLSLSRTQYTVNHLPKALVKLEESMLKQLQPAIRLETPIQFVDELVGREAETVGCQAALEQHSPFQTVLLTGSSGMGKTTLGAYLTQHWVHGPIFWFTIRKGFNDQIGSLLFGLGYFFHQQGESSLWSELIATNGQVSPARALDMVRYILQRVQRHHGILLCIDEVDLLKPAENGEHGTIVNFLSSLRGLVPLLLIGQQVLLDGEYFCELKGISLSELSRLLETQEIWLSSEERQILHEYTAGNPRLIELCLTLHAYGGALAEVLGDLAKVSSVEFLLSRILQRLDSIACNILMALSVYHTPAPVDIWENKETGPVLTELMARHLIHHDGRGGVMLLAAYSEVFKRCLPTDKRLKYHLKAALVYKARSLYTHAAYHLIEAQRPEEAIWLWRTYQQQEINQGQSGVARQLFRPLIQVPLKSTAREALSIICAELERLAGSNVQALEDIHSILWKTPILSLEADHLAGVIHSDQSEFEQAKQLHRQALETAETLVETKLAQIHKGLGWIYMRERSLDIAWREAQLARYEAENLQGYIHETRYEYAEAEYAYRSALEIADAVEHTSGLAKTCNNLSKLYAFQGRFEEAKTRQSQADTYYKEMGKYLALYSAKINWALIFNLSGEYEAAIAALESAFAQFEHYHIEIPAWPEALMNLGMAEALIGMCDTVRAKPYIQNAIHLEEVDVLPDAYRLMGIICLQNQDYVRAKKYIQESIDMTEDPNSFDPHVGAYAWRTLAQVHLAQKDYPAAIQAKQTALDLFESINLPFEINRTHELLLELSNGRNR